MSSDAEALFAAHYQPLVRYLSRAASRSEASDLAQDVFLRVSRAGVPAGSARDTQAWICRIARNLVIDHHRRRLRQAVAGAGELRTARPATQDVRLAVNEALAALPALERDVFLMREVGGLGYAEIAVACDLTPDAVRSRIHRARLQLRQTLAAPIAAQRRQAMSRVAPVRPKDQP
jgi:RNA polymerase sigma-70 factor (ECF subfamily)